MTKFKAYFQAWKDRLKSDTPKFFQTMIKFAVSVGGVGIALIAAGDAIPTQIHTIAGYLVAIGTVAGLVAKSATTNPVVAKEPKSLT